MRCVWTSLACSLFGALLAASPALAQGADNLKAGQKFLAQVAKQPGVVKLPDGVLYRVVARSPSPGAQPTVADTVTIDYEGKLVNGTVFDSSYARGEPAALPLDRLVPAWQEVIPLMHVGDEVILYTPPAAAYGDRDLGEIPPNSTLVFRVHLIGIQAH